MNPQDIRKRGDVEVAAHLRVEKSFVNEAVRWRVIVDGLVALKETVPFAEKGLYTSCAELYLYAEERRRAVVAELNMAKEQRRLFDDCNA